VTEGRRLELCRLGSVSMGNCLVSEARVTDMELQQVYNVKLWKPT
jgi:hypothetical protein